jgi:putative peptidoglycan lipid II flippase
MKALLQASHVGRFCARLARVHPDHKRIARSAVRISIFVLAGKCAGALKEMAIAYKYGVSEVVDAYQLTLTLGTFLPTILITAAGIVLIPSLVELGSHSRREQARFIGELEIVSIAIGGFLALFVWFSRDFLIELIAGGLSPEARAMARQFILVICVSSARLQARERHVNTLMECVPTLTLLVMLLVAPAQYSIEPLMWGTACGFVIQAIAQRYLASRSDGIHSPFRTLRNRGPASPQWRDVLRSLGIVLAGGAVIGLIGPLDQYFMASLGDGAIATMGYANRVLALVLGMGAVAISRAILPVFSEMLAGGERARVRTTAFKWSFVMLGLGAASVALPYVAAPFVVELLFQRGAFTAQDTLVVSDLFRWGLLQAPLYFATLVLVQLFACERRYREIALVAVLAFVVKAAGNYLLTPVFGMVGILLATAAMHAGSLGCYLALSGMQRQPPARGAR